MLRLSVDLTAWQITAGEAFLFEAQLVDANSVPLDIPDEALVLSFYDPGNRAAYETAIGGRRFDAGEYFRWAWPGTFSEQLLGRALRVELARRYRDSKAVLADGQLTVATSAAGVPSLSGAPLGEVVTRATFRAGATPGAAMTKSISLRAWDEGPVAPPAYAIRNGDVVALML